MALAASIVDSWHDTKRLHIVGTIVPSGNYTTNGDSFDFTTNLTDSRPGMVPPGTVNQPNFVEFSSKNGWTLVYDSVNKKILFRGQQPTSATAGIIPLDEMANGAYPASATGDVIGFHAIYRMF